MLISSGQMDTSDVSASSCFSASVAPKTIYIYILMLLLLLVLLLMLFLLLLLLLLY